jgi:hypothetical protein
MGPHTPLSLLQALVSAYCALLQRYHQLTHTDNFQN